MKIFEAPEIGYTPANLKALRTEYGLTQAQVAEITETKTGYSVRRWEAPLDAKNRADMPLAKWVKLLQYIEKNSCNSS
mgnify:FL=1